MTPRQAPISSRHLLPHERLDVFHVAIELNQLVASFSLPRGQADLRDQLRRAATSIALNSLCAHGALRIEARSVHPTSLREAENIGEGASKAGPDGRRYFTIARGSCGEVAATLRVLLAIGAIGEATHEQGRALCGRIYAMLTGLCGHRPSR